VRDHYPELVSAEAGPSFSNNPGDHRRPLGAAAKPRPADAPTDQPHEHLVVPELHPRTPRDIRLDHERTGVAKYCAERDRYQGSCALQDA